MKTSRRIDEIIMFVRLADYLSPQVFSMVFRENENINSSQLCHGKNLYSENNVCKEVVNYQEKIIADIACDHGYIGIGIYEKGLANKVIFSDISKKSLEKAQKLIQHRNDFANFKFIVGNGLEVLSQQIFLSVIAGIGGREIVKILSLSDKVKLSKFLILQTRQDDDYLRMNLAKLGLVVYADKMVKDGNHVYHTFLVGSEEILSVDDIVINFFEQSGMVDKSKISIQGLEFYYQFKNKYYGKNNLFVNTDEHKAMLRFLISMLENQKNILEAKVEMMKGGNVSLGVYLNEIREKISVLDNMLHFAL